MKTEEECKTLAFEIHRLIDNATSDSDEREAMLKLRAFQIEAIMEGMAEAIDFLKGRSDDAFGEIIAERDSKTKPFDPSREFKRIYG